MTRTRFVALAVSIALASASSRALADGAETHFTRGVELYSEADYRSALNEFKRAYEMDPRYEVLYNIALSEFQLLDYAGALQAFEKYLKEGGNNVNAARRAEVERYMQKVRGRVAKVLILADVDGAQITVDDAPSGTTPLASPILVSAGRRKITVSAAGRAPITSTVDVVGGDLQRISVNFGKAPAAGAGTPPAEPPEPPPRRIPWIGWVATGVFAVGAGVTGGLALGASSDLKQDLATLGVAQPTIDSAHSKTLALGIASDALLGAAAIAGGISLYYTLRTPTADASTSARAAVGPNGVRLEVIF